MYRPGSQPVARVLQRVYEAPRIARRYLLVTDNNNRRHERGILARPDASIRKSSPRLWTRLESSISWSRRHTAARGALPDVIIIAPQDRPPEEVVVTGVGLMSDRILVTWPVDMSPPAPVHR